MDHTPYNKKQKQREEPWRLLSQSSPMNNDAQTGNQATSRWFSGSQRQKYPPITRKMGVSHRTRRERHCHSPGADSDVSVISFNSATTFGRFSQLWQQSPRMFSSSQEITTQISQQESQPSVIQETDVSLFNELESQLNDIQETTALFNYSPYPPRERQYAIGTPPSAPVWKPIGSSSKNVLAPSPPRVDHHVKTEENEDMESWSINDDVQSLDGTQLLSPHASESPGPAAKQQEEQPQYVDDKSTTNRHSKNLDDDQLGSQPQPSTKGIDLTADSEEEEEDDQALTTYKLLPHLKDDNLLKTLSWTGPKHTNDIESTELPSQDEEQTKRWKQHLGAASKTSLSTKKQPKSLVTTDDEQQNKDNEPPVLSQKAFGKRRLVELEGEEDMTPLSVSEAKQRSPSVLSFHYPDNESDHDNRPSPIASARPSFSGEQENKLPAQISPGIDYGEDEVEMGGFVDEEESEQPIPDVPRISTQANLTSRLIQGYQTRSKTRTSIPAAVTKSIFESTLPPEFSLAVNSNAALTEATNLYFDQLREDLEAYVTHSGDYTISKQDMELLMTRQRLVTEKISLESLAHQHLPRELWDELCVSALAFNVLQPHHR